jgi:hypothetical protein
MTRLRKRSAFRPRVIQPPSPDDTRGPTPERMRHAQGFVERGNLGRGRAGVGISPNAIAIILIGAFILAAIVYAFVRIRR